MSIRLRLTLWHALVFAAGLIAFELVVWAGTRSALQSELDTWLTRQADGLERFLLLETVGSGEAAVTEETREFSTGLPQGSGVQLYSGAGKLLLARPPADLGVLSSSPGILSATPGARRAISRRVLIEGVEFRYALWRSTEEMDRALAELSWVLVALTPVFLAFSVAGGWFLSRRALRPVDDITAAARHISLRNLSGLLPVPEHRDELRRLCEAWNEMLLRLDVAAKRQVQFTADASHELRTPVALVRAAAEVALLRERPASEYREVLHKILQDCEVLTNVIEGLMELARGDEGATGLTFVSLDFAELIGDVGAQMAPVAMQHDIEFAVLPPRVSLPVSGDRGALRRLLLLLLDNAIKFTPGGGRVSLRAFADGEQVVLEVEDTGVGISGDALPRVFDRFYQEDGSRSGRGVGIGLSIAQWIVHSHNGRIEVRSRLGEGAVFRVTMPLTPVSAGVSGGDRIAESSNIK